MDQDAEGQQEELETGLQGMVTLRLFARCACVRIYKSWVSVHFELQVRQFKYNIYQNWCHSVSLCKLFEINLCPLPALCKSAVFHFKFTETFLFGQQMLYVNSKVTMFVFFISQSSSNPHLQSSFDDWISDLLTSDFN